ncbi:MAG: hypothetical protein BWZ10_02546 [candidate division BRC1 bacterium ADurb.BinA364]|nr:MAG: hypothetical protein BWZ10_02546 [candidate division BRC1 bacterium ADurb.BinA364]
MGASSTASKMASRASKGKLRGGRQDVGSHSMALSRPVTDSSPGGAVGDTRYSRANSTAPECDSTIILKAGSIFSTGGGPWKSPSGSRPSASLVLIVVLLGPPGGWVIE